MNLLFVNEIPMNPLFGGIERVTDLLTKELIARGHNVYYLCTRIDDDSMLDYEFPVDQLVLPNENGFFNHKNIQYYRKLLETTKIDVVINQRGWAPLMNPVLKLCGVPTISVIHTIPKGMHIIHMNGILHHNNSFDGFWRYIIKLLIYPLYYLYKYLRSIKRLKVHYWDLMSNSDAVVLLSQNCKKELDLFTRTLSPKCPTYSIPNPNTYSVCEFGLTKKEKVLLYVGRMSANEKNPLRLLKIWKELYQTHRDWRLIFVGDGDALPNMKTYSLRHKLERVEFAGKQSNVKDYYVKSDFICLTSNFEGWGLTLTEGMSFGCIPFTFNNYGAASEIIDDQINGCLIPPFSLKIYAERLSELMNNHVLRNSMSKAAMEKVESFSVVKVANQWENLFNKVLARS